MSDESSAVKVEVPAVTDVTEKLATPDEFVIPLKVVIVSVAPLEEERVTVFPEITFPYVSFSVTAIVLRELPSATTELGEAATVEIVALTGPAM